LYGSQCLEKLIALSGTDPQQYGDCAHVSPSDSTIGLDMAIEKDENARPVQEMYSKSRTRNMVTNECSYFIEITEFKIIERTGRLFKNGEPRILTTEFSVATVCRGI